MHKAPRQQITASADGTPLFLRHQPRRKPGALTVLLGHAMTVHGGLLGVLTDQLAELGCDVWAGDLRGHGQSVSGRAPLAHLDPETGWDRLVDDMAVFARRAFDGVPVENRVMFGGVLSCQAMLLLLQRQPDCARHLVMAPPSPRRTGATRLAATFLRLRKLIRPVDQPDSQLMHHVYSFLKAGLPPGASDVDIISAFPDVTAAILADPRGFPTPTMGYWLNVLPGLQRLWDEIRPGDLDPATRVLLVSSPEDPQLHGKRLAAEVQDWFAARGLRDCSYLDLPQTRANPMVDAAHVPIARLVLDWVLAQSPATADGGAADMARKAPPPAPVCAVPPPATGPYIAGIGDPAGPVDLPELIQLCYAAMEDDGRWMELIHRLCLMSERDSQRVEQIMEAIQPHWQRAYELREQLRKAAMLGVIYSDVIDRLDLGVGLVDAEGALQHANPAFEAALAGLMPSASEGQTAAERCARLLAAQSGWPPPGGDVPLLWEGRVVGVSFVPASLSGGTGKVRGPAPRLLVLRSPGPDSVDQRAGLLSLSFGLTGQESQVALLVADGHATGDVGARLSMSEHTVRSHLKQVFAKMAVTSRTEMASQIMASPLGWMTGRPAASGAEAALPHEGA
ncbi:MAG: serine aminopeptidase domain-containing protein [Gemmobacter sp.]